MDNNELKKALLQAFSEEAPEILQKAESALLDLESADDENRSRHADALKRSLHSLKGSASAIGRADIRNVCHVMEEMLLDASVSVAATSKLDKLHLGLSYLKTAANAPDVESNADNVIAQLQSVSPPASASPKIPVELPVEKAQHDKPVISSAAEKPVVEVSTARNDRVEKGDKESSFVTETIRVSVDKIENMQSTVGELVAIRLQQEDGLNKLKHIQQEVEGLHLAWHNIKAEIHDIRQLLPSHIISKLDTKMSAFSSEIKSTQRQVFQLANQSRNQSGQLSLLSDEMDTGLRAIRMMPLAPFLESYRAVAREAARHLGKSVFVECIDKGVEVDRLVLERIKEPILHLIRNCVSHGIESPAQRQLLGKPDTGNIKLTAEISGDYVYLQVIDDGAGFNRSKIFDKAVKLGLMKADEELTNDKLLDLVSRTGFSTAIQTDMVSGRGIGMDVVATMVTELGGKIELETEEGLGTCFTLQVPSSLSTTQGLILQIGSQRFGLALDMVERIVRTKIQNLSLVEGKQVLTIDKEPIAVTSLAAVLNLAKLEPRNTATSHPIVILRAGNRRLALIVDDIPGEIPLIIKSMGPQFERIQIYSGGAILSDGGVLPVVNARHIVSMVAENSALRMSVIANDENYAIEEETQNDNQGIVIVVDDSITTRTLERNILEAAGYRVSVATDGVEALDLLMTEDNVALLVTDLEMPRMNGIELCRNIRAGRFSELPIIMVTSVGNENEKRKGLEAGADAYIVKSDFQQEHFLEMVSRFARH